jgi:putative transposase
MLGALVGLVVRQFRSRTSLIAENELLRQQLAAAKSRLQRKRVMFTGSQRLTIALLTRCTASWRMTVTLVQPATVLRWHREGLRLLWRWRSRPRGRRPTRYATLIREMAARNPRWGAERLRGELLKLGIWVSKRTVQRYMKNGCPATATAGVLSSATTLPGLVTSCRPSTCSSARSSSCSFSI